MDFLDVDKALPNKSVRPKFRARCYHTVRKGDPLRRGASDVRFCSNFQDYFSAPAAAARPALAHFSSASWVGVPLMPRPPILSAPIMMGTPPPKGMMSTR